MTVYLNKRVVRRVTIIRTLGITVFVCSMITAASALAENCTVAALNGFRIPSTKIISATDVPAATPKPEYCDVKGSVATNGEGAGPNSADFELMLPANWNGKFMFGGSRGTGGSFASSANLVDVREFLIQGYAGVTTDGGHLSSDRNWYFTSPGTPNIPKLVDFFYRSVHQVALATKQLVKDYYNSTAISHSYFDGCSNGGREGLIEAVQYPGDFDGIIAGSSWLDPLGNALKDLKNAQAFLDSYIPLSKIPAIVAAVNKQCDALDGVIQNPAACSFRPESLVPGTLTKAQADALNLYFEAVRDQKGNLIYPGSPVSDLQMAFGPPTAPMVETSTPPANPKDAQPWGHARAPHLWQSAGTIRTVGYYNPSVNLNNTVIKGDVADFAALKLLYGRMSPDIVDDPSRLQPFLQRGGKLLMYHGFSDPVISPFSTVWFYEDLAADNGGYNKIQKQVRLFMVPAMQHCQDGPTPTLFDTLTALDQWVEKGVAPDAMIGSHTTDKVVDRTVLLCKFPEEAHYKGSGAVTDAKNWVCPAGDRSLLKTGLNGVEAGANGREHQAGWVKSTPKPALWPQP